MKWGLLKPGIVLLVAIYAISSPFTTVSASAQARSAQASPPPTVSPSPQATQPASSNAQIAHCDQALGSVWDAIQARKDLDIPRAVYDALSPATSPKCAQEYLMAVAPPLQQSAVALFRPVRQSLFTALQNYSAQQQTTSSTSSTASVSPVSKVTGPSAIAEEFSGVTLSSSTSAMTFTFAPGSLLTNLEQQGVILPCSSVLSIRASTIQRDTCKSGGWNNLAQRLTFPVTANTSTATQSIKGTATSSNPGLSAAPVSLFNAGTTQPTFGGFGVKFVAIFQGSSSNNATPAAQPTADAALAAKMDKQLSQKSVTFDGDLLTRCDAFENARIAAAKRIAEQAGGGKEAFLAALRKEYQNLGNTLLTCLQSDNLLVDDLQEYLTATLVDLATGDMKASQKPLLGFEYDLNTPQNQPSYSSLKGNFSLSFGGCVAAKQKQGSNSCSNRVKPPAVLSSSAAISAGRTATGQKAAAQATSKPDSKIVSQAAGATAPSVTINISVSGDLYNGAPPKSVPSTERLRDFQAGAEIDFKISTSKLPAIGPLIGDSTLAGTYYYQDQTSPSLLKGPPSTITIANLPSTASQVYTTRGPINLGQIRYGLGTGSKVSFPICFTYANRSELITHPIKGLQFGLSYNLSSLFSKTSTNAQ